MKFYKSFQNFFNFFKVKELKVLNSRILNFKFLKNVFIFFHSFSNKYTISTINKHSSRPHQTCFNNRIISFTMCVKLFKPSWKSAQYWNFATCITRYSICSLVFNFIKLKKILNLFSIFFKFYCLLIRTKRRKRNKNS